MPAQPQVGVADHHEIPQLKTRAQRRRTPIPCNNHGLSDEKTSSLEDGELLRPAEAIDHADKPLPSSKVTGKDDLVKYMSSVPSYLQRAESSHGVQGGALNFGVLDWGSLEKWSYDQKQAANRRSMHSPLSSNSSSTASSSVISSSSVSSKSTPAHWKQSESAVEQNFEQNRNNAEASRSRSSGKGKMRHSDMKRVSFDMTEVQDSGSSSSTSKSSENLDFAHCKVKPQVDKSREERFHQSEHARRVSYDSTAVCNKPVDQSRKSFSGNFLQSAENFDKQSQRIPYSCPLPSASQINEPSVSGNFSSKNEVLIPTSTRGKHVKRVESTESLSEKSICYMAGRSRQIELKEGATARREVSPLKARSSQQQVKQTVIPDSCNENNAGSRNRSRSVTPQRLLNAGLNLIRNSGLRERSPAIETKQAVHSDTLQEETAASSSSKSRRSPLRRIFDPIFRSKDQISFCGPDTGFTSYGAREVSNRDKLGISANQALLKLAWKNGRPLFVLSANDNDILAATMGKESVSHKNNFSCVYTIFTAQETKKKGGFFIGQGEKKHQLAYNVVGQMRVSSSESTKDHFVMREFVLVGKGSPVSSELAAVVIQVPIEKPEDDCGAQSNKKSFMASVFAILPNGVHGVSSTGAPTPLIERWRTGGSCDCGGWDEGCTLTILSDATSLKACSTYGTHGIQLLPQGEDREKKHWFRLSAFTEGVYTIEFGPAIGLVQAFATSIAIMHSRKPDTLSGLYYSMKARSLQEHSSTEQARLDSEKARTSYVPNCPPLSPVRRS